MLPASYLPSSCLLAHLAHLTRHAQTRPLPRLECLRPPFLVLNGLPVAGQAQHLYQLGDLGVVPGRPHSVTPRDLLIFHQPRLLDLVVVVIRGACRPAVLVGSGCFCAAPQCRRLLGLLGLVQLQLPVKLLHGAAVRAPDVHRLEQELAANLALVAALDRQAAPDLLHALHDAVQRALQHALVHVGGPLAECQRLDHAQLLVDFPGGVRVDWERAPRRLGVHVDQPWVAAANDGYEGADGQVQEGVRLDRGGEGAEVFLAVLFCNSPSKATCQSYEFPFFVKRTMNRF